MRWLERLKESYSLHDVKMSGGRESAAAKAAEEFLETLAKLNLKPITSNGHVFKACSWFLRLLDRASL